MRARARGDTVAICTSERTRKKDPVPLHTFIPQTLTCNAAATHVDVLTVLMRGHHVHRLAYHVSHVQVALFKQHASQDGIVVGELEQQLLEHVVLFALFYLLHAERSCLEAFSCAHAPDVTPVRTNEREDERELLPQRQLTKDTLHRDVYWTIGQYKVATVRQLRLKQRVFLHIAS